MTIQTNGHQIETEEILQGFLYSYGQLDSGSISKKVINPEIFGEGGSHPTRETSAENETSQFNEFAGVK